MNNSTEALQALHDYLIDAATMVAEEAENPCLILAGAIKRAEKIKASGRSQFASEIIWRAIEMLTIRGHSSYMIKPAGLKKTTMSDPIRIECPSNIEVLLHYHCSPYAHPREDAPDGQDFIQHALELRVLEEKTPSREGNSQYALTPLGRAWVQALCRTALPRPSFTTEHGEPLDPNW